MAGDEHEIMRSLGRLEEGVRQLRNDFDAEKVHTRESRGRTHEKLDHLEATIVIAGQVSAQTRDRMEIVEKALKDDVQPTVAEFKRMKLVGTGVMVTVALAAGALGVSLATIGEQVITALRSWLRIP